jgi:hypothetical protein
VFNELIGEATSAASSVARKFAVRALLAMPFLLGLGFATAALTLMLVERFGPTSAYLSVVGLFGCLGVFASAISRIKMPTAIFHLAVPGRGLATTSALLNMLLVVGIGVGLTLYKPNNPPTGLNHPQSIATTPESTRSRAPEWVPPLL